MRTWRVPLLVILAMAVGCLALVGCGGGSSDASGSGSGSESESSGGGELRIGTGTSVETLDIQDGTEFQSLQQIYPMFDSLLQVGKTGKLEPDLAQSWKVSPDNKTITLQLRHDVKFQDGTPFNAEAVVFNYERETDPKNPYHHCTCTLPIGWLANVEGVKKTGQYTVVMQLKEPGAQALLWTLTAVPGEMESPAALKKYGADFKSHPVGSGPFSFVSWSPSGSLVLKRNPNYWGPKPSIEGLTFTPYTDSEARTGAILSGQVDGILEPTPTSLSSFPSSSYSTVQAPLDEIAYVALDVKRPPFNNVDVRRAFSYALNRKELTDTVLKGISEPAQGFFPKSLFGYDGSLTNTVEYDPAKAKQLLAKAGYPDGVDFNWLVPISGVASPEPKTWATYLQANLAEVGLNAHIQTFESSTTLATEAKGLANTPFNAGTIGWVVLSGDPDTFVGGAFGTASQPPNGFNISIYSNPKVDAAIAKGREALKPAERAAAYKTAQEELAKEMPWIPVFNWVDTAILKKGVAGISIRPNAVIDFE